MNSYCLKFDFITFDNDEFISIYFLSSTSNINIIINNFSIFIYYYYKNMNFSFSLITKHK